MIGDQRDVDRHARRRLLAHTYRLAVQTVDDRLRDLVAVRVVGRDLDVRCRTVANHDRSGGDEPIGVDGAQFGFAFLGDLLDQFDLAGTAWTA